MCSSEACAQTLYACGTCQWIAFVVRPYCSSTSAHSTRDQPWPPCSRECMPPSSPAAIAACLTSAIVSAGSFPPRLSASSSSGIRTSSTNRRARAWRSSAEALSWMPVWAGEICAISGADLTSIEAGD